MYVCQVSWFAHELCHPQNRRQKDIVLEWPAALTREQRARLYAIVEQLLATGRSNLKFSVKFSVECSVEFRRSNVPSNVQTNVPGTPSSNDFRHWPMARARSRRSLLASAQPVVCGWCSIPSNGPSNVPSHVRSNVLLDVPSNVPSKVSSNVPLDVRSNVASNVPSNVPIEC